MNRLLIAVVFFSAATSATWAQDESPVLDEAHFLQAGDEFIKRGDLDGAAQLFNRRSSTRRAIPCPITVWAGFMPKWPSRAGPSILRFGVGRAARLCAGLGSLALLDLSVGDRAGAEAQRDLLMRACGATCPETAQVEKALKGDKDVPVRR